MCGKELKMAWNGRASRIRKILLDYVNKELDEKKTMELEIFSIIPY